MRTLILGGTGFIGKPLCQILATQGHELAVISRGEKEPELPGGIRHIKGDRWMLVDVASEIDAFGPETVIDIYAMTADDDLPVLEFFSGRTRRYVMISSCDVYRVMGRILGTEPGAVIGGLQSETDPLREKLYPYQKIAEHAGGDNYDKIPLEKACLADFGFEGTVLRLPMIYGPGDRQHRFRDMVKHMADARPAILYPETYANWISTYGYIDNVAAAIALAATHEAAAGETFNVGDVNDLTQKGWAEAIAREMNWQGGIICAAADALPEKRAGFALGKFDQLLQIDAAKIADLLGFVPPVDFTSAIHRMVKYELDHLADIDPDGFDYDADDRFLAMHQPKDA